MRSIVSCRTHPIRLLLILPLAVLPTPRAGLAQDAPAAPAPRAAAPAAAPVRLRADSLYAQGEVYRGRQRFDSARMSYEAAIHADPAAPSAANAFNRLRTLPPGAAPEKDPFAAARGLSRAGFDAEARAELKKALAANPGRAVPADLRHLAGGGIGWWRGVRVWSERVGRPALEIAALLVAAALAGWWLARFLFAKPLLQIADFEGAPGSGEDGKGELDGVELSALVESHLKLLAGAMPLTRSNSVQGPIEPLKVPVEVQGLIGASAPWVSLALSLLAWLRPQKVLRIHGLLLPPGPLGRGVMLRLTQGDGVVDSVTLWERHFLPSGAAAQLAERGFPTAQILAQSAATWALFRAGEVHPRLGTAPAFRALGTVRWKSYALFSAAARLDVHGILPEAEHAYWAALREDGGNLGARLNLGAVLVERKRPALGIRQLERVAGEAEDAGAGALRYPALYRESVAWYELAYQDGEDRAEHLRRAQVLSGTLLREIEAKTGPGAAVTPALRRALQELYPTAKCLDVGLRAVLGAPVDELSEELGTQFDDLPAGAAQYNLASTYAIFAQHSESPARERWVNAALEHLDFALRLDRRQASSVRGDPSFAGLWDEAEVAERLAKLLRSYGLAPEPASPLERVAVIGTYAGGLARAGVEDAAGLEARCATAAGRLGLADALGVTVEAVERWRGAAGLLEVPELGVDAANALWRAGVHSRAELARCVPGELTARLEELAVAAGEPDRSTFFQVAAWIAGARAP